MIEGYKMVKKVADLWGVRLRTLQSISASGRIPGVAKFSNTWDIHKDAVKPKNGNEVAGTV
jgi:predicted site-specific integrase-resolvase